MKTGFKFACIALWALCGAAPPANAQVAPDIWPRPIPRPNPVLNQELQLVSQSARVEINNGAAHTKLTQIFENTTNRTIEGTYVFPLPEGAAVNGFAMTVNGKRIEAEILDGDKARTIYTGIVQKMRDPAILEFIDRNLIRARIFPIPPRAQQTLELAYSEALKPESSSFRYVLPLRLPIGGAARRANVDIRINAPDGVRAVYSPTHSVQISRDGNGARISGEWGSLPQPAPIPLDYHGDTIRRPDGGSDRDFVLYYTTATGKVGVNLVTYRTGEEDGYFMLLAAPDATVSPKEIAAKDVVFVCDTSGSMEGEKIEQTRRALLTLLGNLNPDDRFNIVTFSSDVRALDDSLLGADKKNIDEARNFARQIKAVGGTNINDALVETLKFFKRDERPHQIVFMTDGEPTVGETNIAEILKNVRQANGNLATARLFVFGVGYDVNTRLLDTLAEDNRGSSDYVLPQEDIEQKVGSLYSKLAYPVLSNPSIDWGGMKVYDVYPKRLPDLFRGMQVVLFGRYSGAGKARIQLVGNSGGHEQRIAGQGGFEGENQYNETIPRLWAMRKVGYLLDDYRRSGSAINEEVKNEIIHLSKRYGIVTPFTAGLITEDGGDRVIANEQRLSGAPSATFFGGNGAGGVNGPAGAPGPKGDMGVNRAASAGVGGFASLSNAAPSSGAAAVHAAKATKELRDATTEDGDRAVRYIGDKAFFLRNGVWVDGAYEEGKSPKPVAIRFGSEEYFALLKDANIAKWLSVGDHVLLVLKNRVIQVEP